MNSTSNRDEVESWHQESSYLLCRVFFLVGPTSIDLDSLRAMCREIQTPPSQRIPPKPFHFIFLPFVPTSTVEQRNIRCALFVGRKGRQIRSDETRLNVRLNIINDSSMECFQNKLKEWKSAMKNGSHSDDGLWIMISMKSTKRISYDPARGRALMRNWDQNSQSKVHQRRTTIVDIASFNTLIVNRTVDEVLKKRWDQTKSNVSESRSVIRPAKFSNERSMLPSSVEITCDTRWRPKRRQVISKIHRKK